MQPGINTGGIGRNHFTIKRRQTSGSRAGAVAESVQTISFIERQSNRSKKLSEFTCGAAAAQVHLEKPVLTVNEAGRIGKVTAIAGRNHRDTGRITFNQDGGANMIDTQLTVELRQAPAQSEIARKHHDHKQNHRPGNKPFQDSHAFHTRFRWMS